MPNWKKVITSGSDAALNSLNVTSTFTASGLNYPTTDGSTNQSLITDGAGNLTFGNPYSDNTIVYGKNLSGATIEKGTPLYFTGSGTAGNLVGVFPADASNPARMPAGGIAGEQLLDEAEGVILLDGFINGVDTSAFGSGDLVYVGVGGGYTNIAPTGSSNLVQALGYVEKVSDTNGSGVIKGPGVPRSVPNIQQGYTWVGNEDDVPTPTATSSLNVASATNATNSTNLNVLNSTTNASYPLVFSLNTTAGNKPLYTDNATTVYINPSTNVIGATTFIGALSGNATTATTATQTSQAVTFNNSGTGAASGTTFNGSTARTISYNTIGAQPLLTNPVTGTGVDNRVAIWSGTTTQDSSANLTFDGTTLTIVGNINTGLGATEVYLMNQNVRTTDSVTFNGLNMNNGNITNVNNIIIADPGPGEGIEWAGGNGFKIYESPDDLTTNSAGNLQIVADGQRRATFGDTGQTAFTVEGSGSTILDIQGSQGQLFSVTDDLTGDIFTVSDISGIPILSVNADGTTTQDGDLNVSGDVTLSGLANQASEATAVMINGSNIIGTRELGTNAFNSTAFTTCTGTVTSVTAGAGMTQTGTSTVNPTLNVIGGTAITVNADNIEVTAACNTAWNAKTTCTGTVTSVATSGGYGGLTLTGGTITTSGTITLGGTPTGTWPISVNGNAATANTWTTARTLTIGSTGKSVNGSGNVSWTLAEIGAAATSHTHTIGYFSTEVTTNLDTYYSTGQFGFSTATTGRPENYGQGINIVSNGTAHNNASNWITQLAFGTSTNTAYFRGKTNSGAWGSWNTFYHTGNLSNPVIGTGVVNQIPRWSGTNSLTTGCGLTYDGVDFIAQGRITMGESSNSNAGTCSSITGGSVNTISTGANCSFIGSGRNNVINASSIQSVIGGGCLNNITGNCNIIAGGCANTICSTQSFIGGGVNNCIFGSFTCKSVIAGGQSNTMSSSCQHNFIGGGWNNRVCTNIGCSGIIGGRNNALNHGDSFVIGSNLTSTAGCYTFVNNLCSFGALSSDARIKENISNVPYGLCEVKQLEPVRYSFKNDESKTLKYGFLAQCVQQIMPDLITTHPTDLIEGEPVLQFDKEAIWSSLVNAIKQQQIQIDELKAEIELLKNS